MDDFIEKFAEAIDVEDYSAITPDTKFRSLDGWSSISVLSLIAMFDEEYNKELSPADIKTSSTVGDLYNLTK